MKLEISVRKNKEFLFSINREVFALLFDNTIVRRRKKFLDSLCSGFIQYDDFIRLTRIGEVPYPLFFLAEDFVKKIIRDYQKAVFFGVSKEQLSISSRGDIVLADISLILKDITRKQNFLKKYICDINDISGRYKRTKLDLFERAKEMRDTIGYDPVTIFELNKEKTFGVLDKGLADHNVFVSLYAHHFTPQEIDKSLQFSGIAINDKKCPFLFIKAGDNDSRVELWGRRLFTAALLLSCLCHGDCRPVTMDGGCRELVEDQHYLFAEEFLMPEDIFSKESCSSLTQAKLLADKYSVSPTAVVMRLFRLKIIGDIAKNEYLDALSSEWLRLTRKKGGGTPLGLEKGINRYNNQAVVGKIVSKYNSKDISLREARNLLCYKKGDKFNMKVLQNV